MNKKEFRIKISFVKGLNKIVIKEVKEKTSFDILENGPDYIYINFNENYTDLLNLRSVSTISVVLNDPFYNPTYISKHKSILKRIIDEVLSKKIDTFKTFKISCAGSTSPEVRNMIKYVETEYKLKESAEADLKISVAKVNDTWEIAVQATRRPLSVRDYKINNMSGAMDPTIAYALNSLCELGGKKTYLNVFSGSATLLIEAGLSNDNLEVLVGFDNNKTHLSFAYQNIKKAGLIQKIKLYEKDIFSFQKIGKFDVVVADLPFGMVISKNEDLDKLYKTFLDYASLALDPKGILGVYTSEFVLFQKVIEKSDFKIIKKVDLKLVTNVGSYLYPKMFICKKV